MLGVASLSEESPSEISCGGFVMYVSRRIPSSKPVQIFYIRFLAFYGQPNIILAWLSGGLSDSINHENPAEGAAWLGTVASESA